jgi:EamA domain-containing membrane protein RarD
VLKLLLAVVALIAAVMIAGVHFRFNPAIPIFIILGFGLYGVTRIGGPLLPVNNDTCGGADPRQGDGFR